MGNRVPTISGFYLRRQLWDMVSSQRAAASPFTIFMRLNHLFLVPKYKDAVINNVAQRLEASVNAYKIFNKTSPELFKLALKNICSKIDFASGKRKNSFAGGLIVSACEADETGFDSFHETILDILKNFAELKKSTLNVLATSVRLRDEKRAEIMRKYLLSS